MPRPVEEAGRVAVVLLVLRAREDLPQGVGREWRRRRAPLARHCVANLATRSLGSSRLASRRLPCLVDCAAVGEGGDVDVLGRFEAPLDLEGAYACGQQLGHVVDAAQVLRREQILGRVRELRAP